MAKMGLGSGLGSIACHFNSTKFEVPGEGYPICMLNASCWLSFLLWGYTFHNKLTSLGPLLTTLTVFLSFSPPTITAPTFIMGTSWAKSIPSWFFERTTGVPLTWMSMGNLLLSWSLTSMTRKSLNLPLVSLNIVTTIFCDCFLWRIPAGGSHIILMPLLLERWTFWDLSSFLVWRKVLPISEVKASSS